jgi:hypothetical protein
VAVAAEERMVTLLEVAVARVAVRVDEVFPARVTTPA